MSSFLTTHQFSVMIGSSKFGFAKVSNLAQELEYDSIQEGGRNSSPLLFRKPKSKMDTLILERGVKSDQTNFGILQVGNKITGLILYVGSGTDMPYTFDNGVITKVELENLDAMGNNILIRKIEIAHSGLHQMSKNKT